MIDALHALGSKRTVALAFSTALMLLCPTGCDHPSNESSGEDAFDYTQSRDEFADVTTSTASGSFWINEDEGKYLHLAATCLNNTRDRFQSELVLQIDSQDDDASTGRGNPTYIDAVLYKLDQNDPAVYYDPYSSGSPKHNFRIDLSSLIGVAEPNGHSLLVLRFVYGAPPLLWSGGTVQDFSGYPSTDVKIPLTESNFGKVLSDCSSDLIDAKADSRTGADGQAG